MTSHTTRHQHLLHMENARRLRFGGHLRYVKDDPIFITTLESDICSMKGKLEAGDVEMMSKRLRIFRFYTKIQHPEQIAPCKVCFSKLILGGAPATTARVAAKRRLDDWSVQDVISFLKEAELEHVTPGFVENAIDGAMLCQLTEEDMVQELKLSRLQARKVKARLVNVDK